MSELNLSILTKVNVCRCTDTDMGHFACQYLLLPIMVLVLLFLVSAIYVCCSDFSFIRPKPVLSDLLHGVKETKSGHETMREANLTYTTISVIKLLTICKVALNQVFFLYLRTFNLSTHSVTRFEQHVPVSNHWINFRCN